MLCGRNDYGAGVSAAREAVPAASSFRGALLLLKDNGISLRQDSYKPGQSQETGRIYRLAAV